MSNIELWIIFLGMGLITIFNRSIFLIVGSKLTLSPNIHEFLKYAPTGAMIAIIIPIILFSKDASLGLYQLNFQKPEMWGAIAGILTAYFCKQMLITICVGMLAFLLMKSIIC